MSREKRRKTLAIIGSAAVLFGVLFPGITTVFAAENNVPERPEGNKDYAETLTIPESSEAVLQDGVLTVDTDSDSTLIPFNVSMGMGESYVYEADITISGDTEDWHGARLIFAPDGNFEKRLTVAMFQSHLCFVDTDESDGLLKADVGIDWPHYEFARTSGQTYKLSVYVNGDKLDVWIDNQKITRQSVVLSGTAQQLQLGLEAAACQVKMENLHIYKTTADPKPEPEPEPEPEPVPSMPEGNRDYAETLTIPESSEAVLQDGVLTVDTDSDSTLIPFNVSMGMGESYVYEADITISGDTEDWHGARLIFAPDGNFEKRLTVAMFQSHLCFVDTDESDGLLKADVGIDWPHYEFARTSGQTYKLSVYVNGDKLDVWIDNQKITRQSVVLSGTAQQLQLGLEAAACQVKMENIHIYKTTADGSLQTGENGLPVVIAAGLAVAAALLCMLCIWNTRRRQGAE